jgi:hypothetical protein
MSVALERHYTRTSGVSSLGNDSTGFMQATPGDMKSFRSSAERIALILTILNVVAETGDKYSGGSGAVAGQNWQRRSWTEVIHW